MKSKNAISTNQAVKPRSRRTKSFVSNTLSKKLFFKENIQPLSAKKDKQNDTIQNIEDTADKRSKIEAIGTIDLLGKTASEQREHSLTVKQTAVGEVKHEWDVKIEENENALLAKARKSGNPVEYLFKENEQLRNQLKESEIQKSSLVDKNSGLSKEIEALKQKLGNMSNRSKVKKVEISLKSSPDTDGEILKLKQAHTDELITLKEQINNLSGENIQLTEKLSKLSKQLFASNNDRSTQSKSIKSLNQKIESLELENRKIKIQNTVKLNKWTEETKKAQQETQEEQDKIQNQLQEEIENLQSQLRKIENRSPIRVIERIENSQTDLRIADLTVKIDEYNSQLTSEKKLFCHKEMECESLKLEVDKLTDLGLIKNDQIRSLGGDIEKLMHRIQELEETSESLIMSVSKNFWKIKI